MTKTTDKTKKGTDAEEEGEQEQRKDLENLYRRRLVDPPLHSEFYTWSRDDNNSQA